VQKLAIIGESVPDPDQAQLERAVVEPPAAPSSAQAEIGGREGPDPTRYGDWEKNGRCIDF
jgi:hypothetical protein